MRIKEVAAIVVKDKTELTWCGGVGVLGWASAAESTMMKVVVVKREWDDAGHGDMWLSAV